MLFQKTFRLISLLRHIVSIYQLSIFLAVIQVLAYPYFSLIALQNVKGHRVKDILRHTHEHIVKLYPKSLAKPNFVQVSVGESVVDISVDMEHMQMYSSLKKNFITDLH